MLGVTSHRAPAATPLSLRLNGRRLRFVDHTFAANNHRGVINNALMLDHDRLLANDNSLIDHRLLALDAPLQLLDQRRIGFPNGTAQDARRARRADVRIGARRILRLHT